MCTCARSHIKVPEKNKFEISCSRAFNRQATEIEVGKSYLFQDPFLGACPPELCFPFLLGSKVAQNWEQGKKSYNPSYSHSITLLPIKFGGNTLLQEVVATHHTIISSASNCQQCRPKMILQGVYESRCCTLHIRCVAQLVKAVLLIVS